MTTREKIAHLYRRFGFGASPAELDRAEQMGEDEAMRLLIDYHEVDEAFNVDPFEFAWRTKDDSDPGAYNFRYWWALRMIAGRRPLQEQLTLFWHGHFAVSDGKVEDGPMMLQYMQTLRAHADGKFIDLLKAISKDPAMMRYLDMQRSLRGAPNENFGREVMELFTLGIGNYTEKDVKEAARALTGWSYVNMYYEYPGNNTAKLKDAMKYSRPFSAFSLMPAMHDPEPKTILGQTDFFDGDKFLELLAAHPATARHICTKLWSYFAYTDPESSVIDKMADVYHATGGDIKRILFAMARSPEFWSDTCVRKKIKSPADLCISVCRQMNAGEELMRLRGAGGSPQHQMNQPVFDNLWGVCDRMEKAGLSLLYPIDVSGWKGGKDWVSPAAMVERYRFRGMFVYARKGPGVGSIAVHDFVKSRKPTNTHDVAAAIVENFDVALPPEGIDVVAKIVDKRGGMRIVDHPEAFPYALDGALMVLMAAPETHFC